MKIGPVSDPRVAATPEAKAAGEQLSRVCDDFEGVLLRQLLTVAKVGDQAGSGYGPMIVDALATSITQAGGLGLAKQIQIALDAQSSGASQS